MLILMVRKSRTEETEKQHTLSPNQASGKKMSSPRLRKGPPPGGGLPQPLWESWVQGPGSQSWFGVELRLSHRLQSVVGELQRVFRDKVI